MTYSAYIKGRSDPVGRIVCEDGPVTPMITLWNDEVELKRQVLYLGHSSKRHPNSGLIGKHGTARTLFRVLAANENEGEGMKMGILALARAGKKVFYRTNRERWEWILWSYDEGSEKTLAVKFLETKKKAKGTTVTVYGVSIRDICIENYLFLSPPLKDDVLSTSHGEILIGSAHRHKIFDNGIYVETRSVGDQALVYGINFQSSIGIETGRDRNSLVNSESAAEIIYQIWDELITKDHKAATDRYLKLLNEHEASFDVFDAKDLVQEPVAMKLLARMREEMGSETFFYCSDKCDSRVCLA